MSEETTAPSARASLPTRRSSGAGDAGRAGAQASTLRRSSLRGARRPRPRSRPAPTQLLPLRPSHPRPRQQARASHKGRQERLGNAASVLGTRVLSESQESVPEGDGESQSSGVTTVPVPVVLAGGDKGFAGHRPVDDNWNLPQPAPGHTDAVPCRTRGSLQVSCCSADGRVTLQTAMAVIQRLPRGGHPRCFWGSGPSRASCAWPCGGERVRSPWGTMGGGAHTCPVPTWCDLARDRAWPWACLCDVGSVPHPTSEVGVTHSAASQAPPPSSTPTSPSVPPPGGRRGSLKVPDRSQPGA